MRARLSLSRLFAIPFVTLLVTLSSISHADAQASGTAAIEQPPVERSIYIPYEELWQRFEKKGRGVFLPYEEFQQLWKEAHGHKTTTQAADAPVPYLVSELSAVARVRDDVVAVEATLELELISQGWHTIPLRLGDVAITKAEFANGDAARLTRDGSGYSLLVENPDKDDPKQRVLNLHVSKSYIKSPGRNRVSMQVPQVPISRWDIHVPEAGVDVEVDQMLAASVLPSDQDTTHLQAFVGNAGMVSFQWSPKAEGAKGLTALANASTVQRVRIEDGVVRTTATITYAISRAELSTLTLEVPAGQKVVSIYDANVREWAVSETNNIQRVDVTLFQPTKGSQQLQVSLEQYGSASSLAVPAINAVDAARQEGVIAVATGEGLRAEIAAREGLLQVDPKELPASLRNADWLYSFRYSGLPYTLDLAIGKEEPRLEVTSLTALHVRPEALTIDYRAMLAVSRAGIFELAIDVPAAYEVDSVRGYGKGAQAISVDEFHLGDAVNGMRPLSISLGRKVLGKAGLHIRLKRELRNETVLLTPSGKALEIKLELPRFTVRKHGQKDGEVAMSALLEREEGFLAVYGPESLRLNPSATAGLREVPVGDIDAALSPNTIESAGERVVFSFGHRGGKPSATLEATRRPPHVSARQLLTATVEGGVARYRADFRYHVRYSGVKGLRIDVPADQASAIQLTSSGLRYRVIADAPDLAEGYVAWLVESETEFIGQSTVRFEWERKLDQLDVGKNVTLQVPRLIPSNIDRSWGQIVLVKAEAIDVTPTEGTEGLRPIDPRQDLADGRTITGAASAFEYHGDWALTLRATRYEIHEVKTTSLERGLVRVVLTRGSDASVQAIYRMRSAQQRLLVHIPGDDISFDTDPVRINGRSVALERGNPGEYFIPLVNQNSEKAFLVELRYVLREAGTTLRIPEFPDQPAAQQIYLSVHAPRDRAFVGSCGPWHQELVWRFSGFNAIPMGRKRPPDLLRWVSRGVSVDRSDLENFAVDGNQLLFSTLRPTPGEAGALSIKLMHHGLLQAIIMVIGLVIGLALVPATLQKRAVAVAVILTALVLSGVFAPSFARAAITNGTAGVGLFVAIMWGLWTLFVTWPKMRRARPAKPTVRTTPPPPIPPVQPSTPRPEESAATQEGNDDA